MDNFIKMSQVKKSYKMGEVTVNALSGVDLDIAEGEFTVVVGPSGAGKTTILNILGGMDTPTSGQVFINDRDIAGLKGRKLAEYRRYSVGFVFQFYNLIQNLTALENVELARHMVKTAPQSALSALEQVGLAERAQNFPAQLSGGEQQRVSIARALAKNPDILLCDEPTGALDDETGKTVLALLRDYNRNNGKTVIVITHNTAITPIADKVIKVKNGKISKIIKNEQPLPVEEIEW